MKMDFTEIYSHFDDFLKELDSKKGLIANNSNKTVSLSKLNRCCAPGILGH
jgi:hypothetical protein